MPESLAEGQLIADEELLDGLEESVAPAGAGDDAVPATAPPADR